MPRRAFHRRALALTPLVDIIFLLLLFFMLSSTFSRYGEIEISAATGGGTGPAQDMRFLQVGEEAVRLAGRQVELDALPSALDGASVLVSLDEGVTSQRLIDVMTLLQPVPGLRLTVLR